MSAEKTWDFFIAHAGTDRQAAQSLYHLLAPHSRVFLDSECLLPGDDWDWELALAQRRSRMTIVLISSRVGDAYYAREEIASAVAMAREDKQKHRVIPVYLDVVTDDVPYGLRLKHGFSVSSELSLETISERLLNLLTRLYGVPDTNVKEPASVKDEAGDMNSAPGKDSTPHIDVFISHSSKDIAIAAGLINLLRAALRIPAEKLRCTSVDGYRLPAGATADEHLHQEIYDAKTFLALITPTSLQSTYVLFELGARWATRLPIIPVLASGASISILRAPFTSLNALSCDEPVQVHQLIYDIASILKITPGSPSSYQKYIEALVEQSGQQKERLQSSERRSQSAQGEGTPPVGTLQEVKVDEPKPNLIPVGYGKRHLVYDHVTRTFTEDGHLLAVVARFRNAHERSRRIAEVSDIRAHIYYEPSEFYKNLDRSIPDFAGVDNGIWLDEPHCSVDFARGETKTLILVVQLADGEFGAFDHRIEKIDDTDRLLPRVLKLTADKYHIKVELSGGADGEVCELYHFDVTLRPDFNISP